MVVRADLGATEAAKEALRPVGADALAIEAHAVVDALGIPAGMLRIPARTLIGVDRGERADNSPKSWRPWASWTPSRKSGTS